VITPRARRCSVRRYYDPATGQFTSVDPLVDQTEAPYGYANGDPVNGTDPLGLFCVWDICTHPFDPMASVDAYVNIGRGASFGLTDTIANWLSPGASCTVPQDSIDQILGGAAATLVGGAVWRAASLRLSVLAGFGEGGVGFIKALVDGWKLQSPAAGNLTKLIGTLGYVAGLYKREIVITYAVLKVVVKSRG
jgi:hypothetical protein